MLEAIAIAIVVLLLHIFFQMQQALKRLYSIEERIAKLEMMTGEVGGQAIGIEDSLARIERIVG